MTAPRNIPWMAHAGESVLLSFPVALLLGLFEIPIVARLLLILLGIAAFLALSLPIQIRCWGSLIVPALTPARVTFAVFIGAMAMLFSSVPPDAPLPWRAAATLLLPLVFFVLSRWDDSRTVALLRRREPARRDPPPEAAPELRNPT